MMQSDLIYYFFFGLVVVYFVFPRHSRNIIYSLPIKWHNDYVVVHFRKAANRHREIHYIIPDSRTNFGKIGKGTYDLSSCYAVPDIGLFGNRQHFIVDEGDSIPKKIMLSEGADEYKCPSCNAVLVPDKTRIRTWAFRVKSALTTQAYDFIYGEKRQWAFILAGIGLLVALAIAVYSYMTIQQIKPLVETIYAHTIIGNETLVIKRQ